jgi:NADH-quinone oxidoreductase subunit N
VSREILEALVGVFPLVVPEAVLGLAACIFFVGGTFRTNRHLWAGLALAALALAGLGWWYTGPVPSTNPFAAPLVLDRLAFLTKGIALAAGVVLVLLSWKEVADRQAADYYACLLTIVAGLGLTGSANELVTLFLSLELVSIPTYVLLYLPRHDPAAQEAAIKYFLLSVFSSALLLFGFSYLYGLGGTTNLAALMDALTGSGPEGLPRVAQVALVMVVAGLGFRITAVPFHFYAPDVFQGTSTAGAALLSFVPKVAGFVALFRLLGLLGMDPGRLGFALGNQVPILLWILAAVTMFLGNLLALLQDRLKRLLAYSSVAHAGYMLIALAAAPNLALGGTETVPGGVEAVLFYLVAYGAMTVGVFAVVAYLDTPQYPVDTVDDLAGLSRSHPGAALLMALFLFSLIGIPLTAGFVAKLLVFLGALAVAPEHNGQLFWWLAILGVVNAAIAAWYYLRIIAAMYLRSPVRPLPQTRAWPGLAALWACAAVTLIFGIYPNWLQQAVHGVAAPPRPIAQAQRGER